MLNRRKALLSLGLVAVVLVSLFLGAWTFSASVRKVSASSPPFFVGIEIGWHANVSQAKALIDNVKNYTNLLIIASPSITADQANLNETCDYAYHVGMYIVVYFSMQMYPDTYNGASSSQFRPFLWMMGAKEKYGDHFLGVYFNDEPGGSKLDSAPVSPSVNATAATPNYPLTDSSFVQTTTRQMDVFAYISHHEGTQVFTSDYGLYWFDYQAGFDVVLAQLGWNNSRALQISLTRGAAKVQNKDWGVIVTWTYRQPPYLESGDQLYNDLVYSYNSGAKYAAVYDSSDAYQNSTLTQAHYNALRSFWNYVQNNKSKQGSFRADISLVLPQDFGSAFRSANDTVWGYAQPDSLIGKMYSDINTLLDQYGSRLDIVYGDCQWANATQTCYNNVILWSNQAQY